MKKICAYTRVSTDSNDQQNSLENQKKYFEMKAKAEGVDLVEIYADEGITATHNNRPNFIRMLKDAGLYVVPKISIATKKPLKNELEYQVNPSAKPEFDEIWIKNTSRFARNTLSQEIIDKLITKGVNIFFVEQNIHTKDELSRGLLLKLFQVFDEQDSKDKSLKIRQGRKTAAMAGKLISNGLLFGYDYIDGELIKNEKEAKIVMEIFDLYSQGFGFRRIQNILKEKGYKTRNGKLFCRTSIIRILGNEKYSGTLVTNKWDSGVVFRKHSPKHKDKNEWYIFEDRIEPIVSKEIFEKCQEIRNSKVNTINQKGIYHGTTKYGGMIICGNCGKKYYSNVDRGRQYYNCSNKKNNGINMCDNPNIKPSIIDAELKKMCNGKYYNTVLKEYNSIYINLFKNKVKQFEEALNNDNTNKVDKKKQEVEKRKHGLSRILDLYENMEIEKEEYLKRKKRIEDEISSLKLEIQQLGLSTDEILRKIELFKGAIKLLEKERPPKKFNEDELLSRVEYIKIIKDKENKAKPVFVFKDTLILDELSKGNIEPFYNDFQAELDMYKAKRGIVS